MTKLFHTLFLILLLTGCGKKSKPAAEPGRVDPAPVAVSGVGKILPEAELVNLAMQSDGIVVRIDARKNDTLPKGSAILLLDDEAAVREVQAARARVRAQQSLLKVSEARLREEQAKTENSIKEFARIRRLYDEGAETGQTLDDKRTALSVQEATLKSSEEQLGNDSAKLLELQESVRIAEIALQNKTLRAPENGILLDLTVQTGEYVKSGDAIGEFAPASPLVASCEIDEMFAGKVKTGQNAYILSPGARDTLAVGKVIFAGSFLKKKSLFYEKPGEAEDRRVREVKILPDRPLPLMINSKVECSILVDN